MTIRDPETNFEQLWTTFHHRYPFFALRNVDWTLQYETYRPKVTRETSDDELFDIFSHMLAPLNDGHVELTARAGGTNDTSTQRLSHDSGRNSRIERSYSSSKQPIRRLSSTVSASLKRPRPGYFTIAGLGH